MVFYIGINKRKTRETPPMVIIEYSPGVKVRQLVKKVEIGGDPGDRRSGDRRSGDRRSGDPEILVVRVPEFRVPEFLLS